MSNKTLAYVFAFATLAALFVFMWRTYPLLPERIAVHFDAQGNANNWSDKDSFVLWSSSILVGVNLFVLVAIPMLARVMPDSTLNIPNKAYWVATPERKRYVLNVVGALLGWCATFVNTINLICCQLIYQENVADPVFRVPASAATAAILALIMGMLIATGVFVIVPFRVPKGPPGEAGEMQIDQSS